MHIATNHQGKANDEAIVMFEIGRILGQCGEASEAFPQVLGVLREHLGIRRIVLMLKNDDGRPVPHSIVGLDRAQLSRACYTSSEGIVGKVFSTGKPIVIPDVNHDVALLKADGLAEFTAVPITNGDEVLGILACDHTTDLDCMSRSDSLRIFGYVAHFIGWKIAHSHGRDSAVQYPPVLQDNPDDAMMCEPSGVIVGFSPKMRRVMVEAKQAAATRSPILLRGELGTGKEYLAREIHRLSPRWNKAFVRINCGMFSKARLENMLFGSDEERDGGHPGSVASALIQAHEGTLFLEEIGEMPSDLQVKLHHFLKGKKLKKRDGKPLLLEVRLVCSTSHDLEKLVVHGDFLTELYYQVNVVSIVLPPLRERREDIPALASQVLERYALENGRKLMIGQRAMRRLCGCKWTGNIKELENCLEHAATMASGETIDNLPCESRQCLARIPNFPGDIRKVEKNESVVIPFGIEALGLQVSDNGRLIPSSDDGKLVKRQQLVQALEQTGWVMAKVARQLDITPRQVAYAVRKYRIEIKKF
jgi:Nif-specific regulatory protein